MAMPIITASLAAAVLLLQQILMLLAGLHRAKTGQGARVEGDKDLERVVRRHANLAENAAIFLVVLGLLEMAGANSLAVTIFALVFFIARLAHAFAFSSLAGSHGGDYAAAAGKMPVVLRVIGAMGTVFGGLGAAVYLGYIAYTLINP